LSLAQYADALRQLGRLTEAKEMCLALVDARVGAREQSIERSARQGARDFMLRAVTQQLALIEAELGNHARAHELFAQLSAIPTIADSPLSLGALHRDWAYAAILEGNKGAFDRHFDHTLDAFRRTKNPALIEQCRKLLLHAVRAGLAAAPEWEQHSLGEPENTQDFISNQPLRDTAELIDTGSS
jgi:hypothetical protein